MRSDRRRPALRGPAALAARERSWGARALATVLTLAMLVVIALPLGVGRGPVRPATESEADAAERAPEHLVFVPVPYTAAPAPTSPSAGAPDVTRNDARSAVGGRPGASPAAPADSSATVTPPPARADTSRASIPTPRAVFTPAPCAIPCLERGGAPRTRGGRGVLANGVGEGSLSQAERDSMLREASRTARGRGAGGGRVGAAGDPTPPGVPRQQTGISVPIGLPGGGPTREQRKRDSTLNAEVSARLARVKARADSIAAAARRDSAARRP